MQNVLGRRWDWRSARRRPRGERPRQHPCAPRERSRRATRKQAAEVSRTVPRSVYPSSDPAPCSPWQRRSRDERGQGSRIPRLTPARPSKSSRPPAAVQPESPPPPGSEVRPRDQSMAHCPTNAAAALQHSAQSESYWEIANRIQGRPLQWMRVRSPPECRQDSWLCAGSGVNDRVSR